MGADSSFYVKFIATYAPKFLGYIISALAMVKKNCFRDFPTCSSDWSGNEVNDDIFEGTIISPGMNKRKFNESFYPIWQGY